MASPYIELAKQLPPQLARFLARYPPNSVRPKAQMFKNPFKSRRVPAAKSPSGKITREPIFSLRRQAVLVKLARENGVEELLPSSKKGTLARIKAREENGLRVKGTGVGQKVKGKAWERTLKGRLEKRRQAMLEMPQMIQTWKERGHGRGWKKWPK